MRKVWLLLFSFLVATPAIAGDLSNIPDFNPEDFCGRYIENQIHNQCIAEEQSAYDWLSVFWERASENSKLYCLSQPYVKNLRLYGNLEKCMMMRMELDDFNASKMRRDEFHR